MLLRNMTLIDSVEEVKLWLAGSVEIDVVVPNSQPSQFFNKATAFDYFRLPFHGNTQPHNNKPLSCSPGATV